MELSRFNDIVPLGIDAQGIAVAFDRYRLYIPADGIVLAIAALTVIVPETLPPEPLWLVDSVLPVMTAVVVMRPLVEIGPAPSVMVPVVTMSPPAWRPQRSTSIGDPAGTT